MSDIPKTSLDWGATKVDTDSRDRDASHSPDLDRAHALAQALEPSVSGHGGDNSLFLAACEIGTVLGPDASAIAEVLTETYNPRCAPAWPAAKITREATRAAKRVDTPEAKVLARRKKRAENVSPAAQYGVPDIVEHLALELSPKGVPVTSQGNVSMLLSHAFGDRIRFDEFTQRVLCSGIDDSMGYFPDGEWSDVHTSALIEFCGRSRCHVPSGMADRAVMLHAMTRSYNFLSEAVMLLAVEWDGVPRVDLALHTYWGVESTPATRAASRIWLMGLAARALEPGCKMDTNLIMVGAEGINKSSSLSALVGKQFFSSSPLPIGKLDAMQNIRGKWLWEFQENSGANGGHEALQAFLSEDTDRFRASYGRHEADVKRVCTFVSTSNRSDVIRCIDEARRYMPVTVTRVDMPGIEADRMQILGEAAARVLGGEQHWETDAEKGLLKKLRGGYAEYDAWEDLLTAWIDKRSEAGASSGGAGRRIMGRASSGTCAPFAVSELFDPIMGAIPVSEGSLDMRSQKRVARILRSMGYERSRVRDGGAKSWKWVRGA